MSGSEYTATLPIPASLQARAIRTAISPRLAIRTLRTDDSSLLPIEQSLGKPIRAPADARQIAVPAQSRGPAPLLAGAAIGDTTGLVSVPRCGPRRSGPLAPGLPHLTTLIQ